MIKHCLFQQHGTNVLKWSSESFPLFQPSFDFIEEVKLKKNDQFQDVQFSVKQHYILREKNKKQKWLSFYNCQITSVKENIDGEEIFGIKLTYLDQVLEFYGEIELLLNFMKLYVIQTDFQNKYVLTKKLGKGNFAVVYQARCKTSGNNYAAKVFEKHLLNNEVDVESLIKEISIIRMFNHQQLIKLFEVQQPHLYYN